MTRQTLVDGWQEISWAVPGSALVNGLNHLSLRWDHVAVPRRVIPGSRQIGSTGVTLPIDADLKGFADGGFMALFDEAGQQIDASAGRRGVNVTVLDAQSGEVVEKQGFDTTANDFESAALATFLAQIPAGSPVLVVSHGDATAFLTAEAVAGLQSWVRALRLINCAVNTLPLSVCKEQLRGVPRWRWTLPVPFCASA